MPEYRSLTFGEQGGLRMRIEDFEKFRTLKDLTDYIMESKKCDRKKATAWCKNNVPLETKFQEKILDYLKERYPESFARKITQGAYSHGGTPDILFVYKGRYIGFEVKRPYFGITSKLQEETIKKIRRAGGVAEVVIYVSEVKAVMDEVEKMIEAEE